VLDDADSPVNGTAGCEPSSATIQIRDKRRLALGSMVVTV
jgi:hypothetical protein